MTRRIDYDMAEKVSLALLTRAAFGADAGLRTGQRVGVPAKLIRSIFDRFPIDTRIDIAGAASGLDRRRPRPTNDAG
jgi:hypothetical protein